VKSDRGAAAADGVDWYTRTAPSSTVLATATSARPSALKSPTARLRPRV
jgi:hypothetical protein